MTYLSSNKFGWVAFISFVFAGLIFGPVGTLNTAAIALSLWVLYSKNYKDYSKELTFLWAHTSLFFVWLLITIVWTIAPAKEYLSHIWHYAGMLCLVPLWLSYKNDIFWEKTWGWLKIYSVFLLISLCVIKHWQISLPHSLHFFVDSNRSLGLMMSFSAITLMVLCEAFGKFQHGASKINLLRSWSLFIFMFLALVFIGSSRSALIGLFLGMMYCFFSWVFVHKKYYIFLLALAFILLVVTYVVMHPELSIYQRFLKGFSEIQEYDHHVLTETSWGTRMQLYHNTWSLILQKPWFGSGLGSWNVLYPTIFSSQPTHAVRTAHQDWLQIWMETGLVGLVCFLLWWVTLWQVSKTKIKQKNIAFRAVIVITLTCTMFNAGIRDATLAIPLLLLICIAWHVFPRPPVNSNEVLNSR